MGVVAGAFIAGFGTGCRSSRPRPSPSNEPAPDVEAPSGRPATARGVADAEANGGPEAAATQDAATDGALDVPRKLVPIRRPRTRRVDRDHVKHGQPLPRDYVE